MIGKTSIKDVSNDSRFETLHFSCFRKFYLEIKHTIEGLFNHSATAALSVVSAAAACTLLYMCTGIAPTEYEI